MEYSIGLRYVRSKKRNHFISFVTFASIAGIAVGVTIIIAVLSVMNGFKEEIQTKFLDFTAHGIITGYDNRLQNWTALKELLKDEEAIAAVSPYTETQGMLIQKNRTSGALIKGIIPELETQVSNIEEYLTEGELLSLKAGGWNIILGQSLARHLDVMVGEQVVLLTPQANVTPAGMMPRLRRFTVTGIFKLGMSQHDRQIALVHIDDAKKLNRLHEEVNGIHLRYHDLYRAPEITARLQQKLIEHYWVSDWTKQHSNFFRALELEKLILMIIMSFIIAVAVFNIISALVMVVTEKQADIAILKTMGMVSSRILTIFIVQGCVIGMIGVVAGIIGGVLLALNLESLILAIENISGQKFLASDVYPITEVPSQLLWNDVLITAIIAFVLTVFATIYPAWRATQIKPSEALRYE